MSVWRGQLAESVEGDGNAFQKQGGRKSQDKIDKERIKVRKGIPVPAGEDKNRILKRGYQTSRKEGRLEVFLH